MTAKRPGAGRVTRKRSESCYFDDGSLIRRLHRERVVALSGPRALLMQAAHPLAVSGLLAHSSALEEPYERLRRTALVMQTITFGTRHEADRICRHVRAMHARVRGQLPEAAGPFPMGTPYRADDPKLLMWILYTLVDSALLVYRRYVGPLTREDEAAYWEDQKVVGELFGLRPAEMPASLEELRDYGTEMLASGELVVTDWSRRQARRIVLEPPVALWAQPLLQSINFITVALLPEVIRRQYGFSRLPPAVVRRAVVSGGAEYLRRVVVPALPDRLRLVPAARAGHADGDARRGDPARR